MGAPGSKDWADVMNIRRLPVLAIRMAVSIAVAVMISEPAVLKLHEADIRAYLDEDIEVPRRWPTRSSAQGITVLAALIAGRKGRPDLLDEWRSHLAGETGRELSAWQKVYASLGFLRGALKLRLRDLVDLAWVPADRVLGSRTLSNLSVLVPTVIVGMIIFRHAGAIGIMESMESITATGGLLYGLIRCGRWWRDVKPSDPKPRNKN
jgi:hypothetical protein